MSSANRAARDKYLKWNPGETGEAKRNVSSADGHARKARIARAKKDNPKLVAQLKKDLKYELESGSLSLLSKLRSAETASRCLGAMVLRNFIMRALFRQMARAFYTLLCMGVDHQHVAQLTTEIQVRDQKEEDDTEELDYLRNRVKAFELIALEKRTQALSPILRKYCRHLKMLGAQRWKDRVTADKRQAALKTRAASFFAHRQLRMVYDSFRQNSTSRVGARKKLEAMCHALQQSTLRKTFQIMKPAPANVRKERKMRVELERRVQLMSVTFLVSVLKRNHKDAVRKSFRRLREETISKKKYDVILRRANAKHRYKVQLRLMRRLKSNVLEQQQQRRRLRSVLDKTRVRLLQNSTRQWIHWNREEYEVEEEKNEMRKKMIKIFGRMTNKYSAAGFESWKRHFQDSKRLDLILARAGARMRNRSLNAALGSWCDFLKARNRARKLAGRVFGRLVRGKLMAGWYTWQTFLNTLDQEEEHHQYQYNLTLRVMSRLVQKQLSGGFRTWVEMLTTGKRRERILAKVATRMRKRSVAAAMGSWQALVTGRRHARKLAGRVFGRLVRGKLMAGWYTWQRYLNTLDQEEEHHEYQYNLTLRVMSRLVQKQLSGGFLTWKSETNDGKRRDMILRRAGARMKNRRVAATLTTWISFTQQRQHDRKLAWKVLSRLSNAKITSSFNAWLASATEGRRREEIMRRIAGKIRNRTVSSAMSTWQDMVTEAQATRVLLKRAAAKIMQRSISQALERWCEYVDEMKTDRHRLLKAVSMFKNRVAGAAFGSWSENASESKRLRLLLRRVGLKIKHRTISTAWSSWSEFVWNRAEARSLCKRVMGRLLHVKTHSAWQTWTESVAGHKRYLRLLKKTRARMTNRLSSSAWLAWTDMVKETKRTRNLLKKAALRMKNQAMTKTFERWCETVEFQQRTRHDAARAVKMWTNRTTSMALHTWRDNVSEMVRHRIVVQRTLKKMTMRMASSALSAWVYFAEERKRMRTLVKKVLGKLLNSKMNVAWRTWLKRLEQLRWEHQLSSLSGDEKRALLDRKKEEDERIQREAAERQRNERAILRVLTRIKNKCLVITFDAWYECTSESNRIKNLLRRVGMKIARRSLSASFDGWYDNVQEKMTNRSKVKNCLVRIQKRTLVIALDTWYARIEEKKKNRIVVARCLKKIANRQLDSSFSAWLDYAEGRIHQRYLVGRVLGRLLNSKMVAAWQTWWSMIRRMRAIENGDDEVLSPAEKQCKRVLTRMFNNLQSSAWDTWTSYAAEHKRLEHLLQRVLRRWKNKLMGGCFHGWHEIILVQLEHKRIVKRAAAKWKMRAAAACFTTWSDVAKERKTNRVKIYRCLRKIQNRALDGAFQGWYDGVAEILRLRGALERAAMKMKNRQAAMALGKWCDVIDETKRLRRLLHKAGQRMRNRAVTSAYLKWSESWRARKGIRKHLTRILTQKHQNLIGGSWETWKKKVADFKARLMDQICPRCERIVARNNGFPSAAEMKRQQDLEARERNWNDSVALEMFDANASTGIGEGSPSGSGLRGARALAMQSTAALPDSEELHQANQEVANLHVKSKRAFEQVKMLKERLKRTQAQYELRLQLTTTRSEEQREQSEKMIERMRSELQGMREQWESRTKLQNASNEGLASENELLRLEIEKKQRMLERSIARRHSMEKSLIDMNRRWRDKGRINLDSMDDVLNRVSSEFSTTGSMVLSTHHASAGTSTIFSPERARSQYDHNHNEDKYGGGSVVMEMDNDGSHRMMHHNGDLSMSELENRVSVLMEEKRAVEMENDDLLARLRECQQSVVECEEEMKTDKRENSAAVADMSKLAIAHNIAQHQKIHALSAAVTDLQSKLDDVHTSSMVQIQAKELELVHCRNALRAKEQQASEMTRAYEVAKMEAKSASTIMKARSAAAASAMEMSRVLSVDGGSSILPNVRSRRPKTAGRQRRQQQHQHQHQHQRMGGEQRQRLNEKKSAMVGWVNESGEEQDGREEKKSSKGGANTPTILTRAEYMAMK